MELNLSKIFDYLVYLRHHGFPTPLLDWTLSPFVAQYFAFANSKAENIAIYIYQRTQDGRTTMHLHDPMIRSFSQSIGGRTARHFLQKAVYTIATKYENERGWSFTKHEAVNKFHSSTKNHFITKCIIPSSEKKKVLKKLDDHSLNAFSLFQTTDSLMESLSISHLDLRELNKPKLRNRIS